VLALFSRAEIQWPPLMRSMFTFFSSFNFNIDITAPEYLIPNLDYQFKWWFIMLLLLAAMAFLCVVFIYELCHDKLHGKARLRVSRKFGKIIAQYLLTGRWKSIYVLIVLVGVFFSSAPCAAATPNDNAIMQTCNARPYHCMNHRLPLTIPRHDVEYVYWLHLICEWTRSANG
jgi:hypothetical protein